MYSFSFFKEHFLLILCDMEVSLRQQEIMTTKENLYGFTQNVTQNIKQNRWKISFLPALSVSLLLSGICNGSQ